MNHFDTPAHLASSLRRSLTFKKLVAACAMLAAFFSGGRMLAIINYTMVASSSVYTPLSGGVNIPDLGAGSDLTVTPALPIGFNFIFDGATYTQFQVSDNGYIHFGNDLGMTGYGNAGGDEVIPNDFTDNSGSTPGVNTMRPFVAPLWEELAMANIGGSASYLLAGMAPNRTLTVEWNKVSWRAPTGTDQVSFQVVLHEGTNVIDFIYQADPVALGPLPTASIGLAGITNGDYYSLSDAGTNPTVSKAVNTTTINTKPATGQMYTWTPSVATGISEAAVSKSSMTVYADGSTGTMLVASDFKEAGHFTFDMTDLLGRSICTQDMDVDAAGKQTFRFPLPACPTGVYLAKIRGNGAEQQSKFIKQ